MSKVAIVGAGYVGLPLAHIFAEAGNEVLLVDVERRVVDGINRGESHIEDVPSEALAPLVEKGLVRASSRYDDLREADAILIALATPLTKQREPDLSIVTAAVRDIAERLQKGQLVVLESTTVCTVSTTLPYSSAARRVDSSSMPPTISAPPLYCVDHCSLPGSTRSGENAR